MKQCPNCQSENPVEAAFCMNCGTRLSQACTNCGTNLPTGARFCMKCGQPAADSTPSDEERLTQLAAETPASLADKMRAAHLEGERKMVTVLFADVVDSTALAEQMDPEVWTEVMNSAFKRLTPMIHRYEGTIARLMGDAMLAFFGAPVAHEDDPVRAIQAGLDILAEAGEFADQVRKSHGVEFAVRVGLNTGVVVVGEVGSDLKYEYTAMGDAVNLASRMQSAANASTILISENTHRLAAPFFEFEDRGEIEVKGKSQPVHVYRVLAERSGDIRARGLEGLSSPLVGRDEESNALRDTLSELDQGRGQIVAVMGEAGLGKSRLVAEIRKDPMTVSGAGVGYKWLEGRSLSYQTSTPYAPFVDMFSNFFELQDDQDEREKYKQVKAAIAKVMPAQVDDIAPFLASMLDIKPDDEGIVRVRYLEPPQLRMRVFSAVEQFLEQFAKIQPVVLVMEDLHWVDPTSLQLLEQLASLTDHSLMMILAIFRPRRQEPSWQFHELAMREYPHCYTQISLQPLDENQSRTLVGNLLHVEDLPMKVRNLILSKSEGNPFYVEEVIRSLLDAGLVVRQNGHWKATREIENISVPDTLIGVITARLDRLDETAKRTAQTASVIGREFQRSILTEVYDIPASLPQSLGTLQRRELIRERNRLPEQVYIFKHALTQETIYDSMLHSRRRSLHLRVAECLEVIESEHVNDIARHFLQAQEQQRALPYLIAAADRAARAYSTPEAIMLYTRALDILSETGPLALAQRAYEGKGQALMLAGDYPAALQNFTVMLEHAETFGDIPMRVSALNKLAQVNIWLGQMEETEQNLLRAEELARQHEDQAGLAEMFTIRCGVCTMVGDFSGAEHYLGESVELGRQLDIKEQMVYGLTHMTGTLVNMTRFDEAWEAAQEATQVIDEIGDLLHKAELLASPVPQYYMREGNLQAASDAAAESLAIAQKVGSTIFECIAAYTLGLVAHLHGNYEQAIACFEQSIQAGVESGLGWIQIYALGALGSVYEDLGEGLTPQVDQYHNQALELLEGPMGQAAGGMAWADLGFCLFERGDLDGAARLLQMGLSAPTPQGLINRPRFLIGLALVALENGQLDQANGLAEEARQYVDERAMQNLYPETFLVVAKVTAARGELLEALEQCSQAEAMAEKMNMRPFVWKACLSTAQIYSELGQTDQARIKIEKARSIVSEIAGAFVDDHLRAEYERTTNNILDAFHF